MSTKIKFNNKVYIAQNVLLDISIFLDNEYLSRIAGTIAQKISEITCDNWGKFNQVRTLCIKLMGVDTESGEVKPSSPLNVIPFNFLHFVLSGGLQELLNEKSLDELNLLFEDLIKKSVEECHAYIKPCLKQKEISFIKDLKTNIPKILINNYPKETISIFLKEAGLENIFSETQEVHSYKNKSIFITRNNYLETFYRNKGLADVLLINDISDISIEHTFSNDPIIINIDGASKGNPGPASIGIAFYKNGNEKELLKEVSEPIGNQTNNYAEYSALIRALEISIEEGFTKVEILSDSELVVKQINKIYKVKDPEIKELYERAVNLSKNLNSFKITHIPREQNSKADKLANSALKF